MSIPKRGERLTRDFLGPNQRRYYEKGSFPSKADRGACTPDGRWKQGGSAGTSSAPDPAAPTCAHPLLIPRTGCQPSHQSHLPKSPSGQLPLTGSAPYHHSRQPPPEWLPPCLARQGSSPLCFLWLVFPGCPATKLEGYMTRKEGRQSKKQRAPMPSICPVA